jgi:hypothetical protein
VDVIKRLLEDAESFAKETADLDDKRFAQRTLDVLGLSPSQGEMTEDAPMAGRIQRPATAGNPAVVSGVKTTE